MYIYTYMYIYMYICIYMYWTGYRAQVFLRAPSSTLHRRSCPLPAKFGFLCTVAFCFEKVLSVLAFCVLFYFGLPETRCGLKNPPFVSRGRVSRVFTREAGKQPIGDFRVAGILEMSCAGLVSNHTRMSVVCVKASSWNAARTPVPTSRGGVVSSLRICL